MVLTSAEDGSVRVFHAGLTLNPHLVEANTFDRMTVPIRSVSGAVNLAASLSCESQ